MMYLNLANLIARDDVKCFCRKTHLYGESKLCRKTHLYGESKLL
jgi:hypothetical protein